MLSLIHVLEWRAAVTPDAIALTDDLGAEEIQVRGAAPLPGYWDNPQATAATLTCDGFYRTGDVGTIDPPGYLTIVDRLRDVIITGGEALPRDATGKVLSAALREPFWAGRDRRVS